MTDAGAFKAALESWLAQETGSAVAVSNLALMAGGASQEIWRLDVNVAEGRSQGAYRLEARRPAGGKIYADALDLPAEFAVLQAAHESSVPVPRSYWLIPDLLGGPTILMERLEGETVGRKIVKAPNLSAARSLLPAQMGGALAAIHNIDVDARGLRTIVPSSALTPAGAAMQRIETDLDRIGEPHPAIELCLRWLHRNEPPPTARSVLVHGDYRLGNMVVGVDGLHGVLDWEFAHIGEAAEDLAWGMVRDWRFGVDELRFAGISAPEPFWAAYEAHGGEQIDPERVAYWEILSNLNWAMGTLNQAQRHLSAEAPNLEFASLGRRCAEIELEALALVKVQIERPGRDYAG